MAFRIVIGVCLGAGLLAGTSEGQTAGEDSSAVAALTTQFHQALRAGDSAAALALLAEDAVILESGAIETREAYRAHHLSADIAFAQSTTTRRETAQLVIRGKVAWVVSHSRVTGVFRGRPVDSQGAELMVLTQTPAGWRISAIHWSSRRSPP